MVSWWSPCGLLVVSLWSPCGLLAVAVVVVVLVVLVVEVVTVVVVLFHCVASTRTKALLSQAQNRNARSCVKLTWLTGTQQVLGSGPKQIKRILQSTCVLYSFIYTYVMCMYSLFSVCLCMYRMSLCIHIYIYTRGFLESGVCLF